MGRTCSAAADFPVQGNSVENSNSSAIQLFQQTGYRARSHHPTRSTATDGKWEDDDFRARDATILVEIGSKPMVIENGIKSPSLRMRRGLAQLHLSPPVRGGLELMRRFA